MTDALFTSEIGNVSLRLGQMARVGGVVGCCSWDAKDESTGEVWFIVDKRVRRAVVTLVKIVCVTWRINWSGGESAAATVVRPGAAVESGRKKEPFALTTDSVEIVVCLLSMWEVENGKEVKLGAPGVVTTFENVEMIPTWGVSLSRMDKL